MIASAEQNPWDQAHLACSAASLHHATPYSDSVELLRAAVPGLGMKLYEINGATIASKSQLMDAVVASMNLPDYFGYNWDALDECVRDFEWDPAPGYVVLYSDADRLVISDPEVLANFAKSMLTAIDYWRDQLTPFHAVFVGSPAVRALLHDTADGELCQFEH